MENNYNVGIRLPQEDMFSSGLAYVVIPKDIDRETYIAECYKTGTVSIYSELNGYSNRIPCDKNTLNFITFPATNKEYGSTVSFVLDEARGRPIITGLYLNQKELGDLRENQFKFKRSLDSNTVEISGSPEDKSIALIVNADKEGSININQRSANNGGEINVSVDGDFNVSALENTVIKQYGGATIKTSSKDGSDYSSFEQSRDQHNFKDKEHHIETGKFSINDGEEPFILGNTFKKLFDDFIDEVSKTTVSTAIGQMPILNAQQVASFKEKTKTILSEVGFIDK